MEDNKIIDCTAIKLIELLKMVPEDTKIMIGISPPGDYETDCFTYRYYKNMNSLILDGE